MVGISCLIRLAALHEREALEALQWRASLSNEEDRDALLANPDAIVLPPEQIAAGQVFVAERESRIVGFAALLPQADGGLELDGLFVEPESWKQGVGRALVRHCADFARANGYAALNVVGSQRAAGFYVACGFAPCGTQKTRFGIGLRMCLTL